MPPKGRSPATLEPDAGSAPDPELARVALARVGARPEAKEPLERAEIAAPAARLLGLSLAAADLFVAHPEELWALADLRARTSSELVQEVAADSRRLGPAAGIRRFRRRATARIAARDLGGAAVDEVMYELSNVAEACLRAALGAIDGAEVLAVLALGKLGGSELNYSSDVDVLFMHRAAGQAAQASASRAAAALIALLSEPTEDGVALRVDASLRPEGRGGPL